MSTFDKYPDLKENLKLETENTSFKLTYDGKPIRLQTPPLYCPFGLKQFPGKYDKVSCTLDLSLRGFDEEDKKTCKFLKWYRELEKCLFEGTLYNPDQFNSSIKHPNPQYPPLLRLKTPVDEGKLDVMVWKENNETNEVIYGDINEKFKGNTAIGIINPTPYVLPNGTWGISWKLEQLRIFEPKRLRGCLFLDD